MDKLIGAFQRFIYRDLAFVLGGASVVVSFLYSFGKLPLAPDGLTIALGLGVAYVLGYVIQDLATLCHLVRTKVAVPPARIGKGLYWLYERKSIAFKEVDSEVFEKAKKDLLLKAPESVWADHERVESLKQVGTTLGPSLMISGAMLLSRPWLATRNFETTLGVIVLGLGVALVLLGWLKVTQQAQITLAGGKLYEEDQPRALTAKTPE
jgi:hypothetical protein